MLQKFVNFKIYMPTFQHHFFARILSKSFCFLLKLVKFTIFKNLPDRFFIFINKTIIRHRFHTTAKFEDISPKVTQEKADNLQQQNTGRKWDKFLKIIFAPFC